MRQNKQGITLIELLGALVLLGILIGLISSTIAIFIRTSNESVTETQVQTEGLLLVRSIESRINNFGPNGIDDDGCVSVNAPPECLRLIRVVDSVETALEIYLFDNQIFVGENPVFVRELVVSDFEIIVEEVNNNVIVNTVVKLKFDLSDTREFTFRSSNLFRQD